MTMFDPAHPSLFIKEELEATGATIAKAALALKITRSQLHRIVKGQSAITIDFALKFEAVFGFKAEMLIKLQTAYDFSLARKSDDIKLTAWQSKVA
ncbi:MAG: HigA family addiction module antidote protein [Rhizobiales bacterium]|nr:HigA family addiction module antidote protein [Hyphomicrobiales bacterium]